MKDSRSLLTLHCCLCELSSLTSRSRSTVVNLLFSSWDLRKNPLSIWYLLSELAALADVSFSRGAFCLDFFPETPRNTLWTANDNEFFWFFSHGGNEKYWFLLVRWWGCEKRGSIDRIRGVGFLRYLFSSRSITTQSWINSRTSPVKRRVWLCISSKRCQLSSPSITKAFMIDKWTGTNCLSNDKAKCPQCVSYTETHN